MHPFLKKTFSIIVMACLLSFISNRIFFYHQGFLERTAAKIVYPFIWVSGTVASTLQSMTAKKVTYAALQEKYQQLCHDHSILLEEVVSLHAQEHLYNQIKELVEFKERYNHQDSILAKILVKNIASNEHYFLVNCGKHQGITQDMVALYQNNLIGRVTEAYDSYSKVLLITDQHCKIAAYTGKTHADGIAHGYNCISRCKLTYVSHLFKIEDNDLVISSGQGLVFPEGFCLGKIVSHILQEKSLYHQIEIEPLVTLESITHCLLAHAPAMQSSNISENAQTIPEKPAGLSPAFSPE